MLSNQCVSSCRSARKEGKGFHWMAARSSLYANPVVPVVEGQAESESSQSAFPVQANQGRKCLMNFPALVFFYVDGLH